MQFITTLSFEIEKINALVSKCWLDCESESLWWKISQICFLQWWASVACIRTHIPVTIPRDNIKSFLRNLVPQVWECLFPTRKCSFNFILWIHLMYDSEICYCIGSMHKVRNVLFFTTYPEYLCNESLLFPISWEIAWEGLLWNDEWLTIYLCKMKSLFPQSYLE